MDQVEEIKKRLDVADIVGGYLQLKQAGRNLKAPCPFHGEKTASFMVSPEKNIWHCFGCGEGGDIYKFVMMMEGVDFKEALEQLARKAGVELAPASSTKGRDNKLKDRLYSAHDWAVKYYQATLMKNQSAIDYVVKKRGFNREVIKSFGIGYSPDNWEGLTTFLKKKGFSEDELVSAGLAAKKRGVYDMFRRRIMLPICDGQGRPIGFSARVTRDDDVPKYLNTPQTLIYDKSRAIYGLHLAREAIRQHDEVILVEGNLDVVASHQAGIKQVVAASGTALTIDQLKALSMLTKNIKLAFDFDKAGLAATERAVPLVQKLGMNLFVISLGESKDPDELIRQDPQLWEQAIKQAKEIREYWLERSSSEFDLSTGIGKIKFVERMAQVLGLYDDSQQEIFAEHIAKLTGVESETILKAIGQAPMLTTESKTTTVGKRGQGRLMIEESVLAMALAFPDTRLSLADLGEADFTADRGQLAMAIRQAKTQTAEKIALELPNLSDYVKILTLRGEEQFGSLAPADRSFESFMLVRRLQTLSNKQSKTELAKQLREAEKSGDTKLARTLLKKYQSLIVEDA